MSLKVGIISLYYNNFNYGGLLQSKAMCSVLEKMGCSAEQICYKTTFRYDDISFYKFMLGELYNNNLIKKIIEKFTTGAYITAYKKLNSSSFEKRLMYFKEFQDAIPHSQKVYTYKTIEEAVNDYDVFVTGSDQVWNSRFHKIHDLCNYCLKFVPDSKKKISYAASIAIPSIDKNIKDEFMQCVERLDSISLREKSALNLFDTTLRERMNVVLDPTLLLSADEWSTMLKINDSQKKNPFLYAYFLGGSEENRKNIRKYSSLCKKPVVASPYLILSKMKEIKLADENRFDIGPREFVENIKNCDCVLTNSFHACVFSLLYHKDFFVFERDPGKHTMHSRLSDFLEEYGLQDRLVKTNEDLAEKSKKCKPIDWEYADAVLEKRRSESMEFLKNALK